MARSRRCATPLALAGLLALAAAPASAQRPHLDVTRFADVPSPGTPEGIVVVPGGHVFVGSNRPVGNTDPRPSVLFEYDAAGNLVDQLTIQGQSQTNSGLLGMAADSTGAIYVLDRDPPRVLHIDPATGAQTTYATFHDVPNCATPWQVGDPCGADSDESGPTPNYPVFAADGTRTLYVTDSAQGLIWRVPPDGGVAEVWFSHADLDGIFGPNGIQFRADGTTLLFAMTGYQGPALGFTTGRLYELPVLPNGDPDAANLSVFWQSQPVDGPDGFSLAASGNVYVALAGTNQLVVVGPTGSELDRVPPTPADNALLDPPMDMPASTGFLGDVLLMTNQSLFTGNAASWVVYDVFADEPGLPLHYPLPEPGREGLAVGAALLAALARRRRCGPG